MSHLHPPRPLKMSTKICFNKGINKMKPLLLLRLPKSARYRVVVSWIVSRVRLRSWERRSTKSKIRVIWRQVWFDSILLNAIIESVQTWRSFTTCPSPLYRPCNRSRPSHWHSHFRTRLRALLRLSAAACRDLTYCHTQSHLCKI